MVLQVNTMLTAVSMSFDWQSVLGPTMGDAVVSLMADVSRAQAEGSDTGAGSGDGRRSDFTANENTSGRL